MRMKMIRLIDADALLKDIEQEYSNHYPTDRDIIDCVRCAETIRPEQCGMMVIEEMIQLHNWISFNERPPDKTGFYLTLSRGEVPWTVELLWYYAEPSSKAGFYSFDVNGNPIFQVHNVTYWTPLPKRRRRIKMKTRR